MTRRAQPAAAQAELFSAVDLERDAAYRAARERIPAAWASLPDGPSREGLPTGKCLYDSPARGLAARAAEAALWRAAYDNFGSSGRSHMWDPDYHYRYGDPVYLDRHEPTTLSCDLRYSKRWDGPRPPAPCGHDERAEEWLLYRGACQMAGCDWEGPERGGENAAVEDGMDHAWPGWRDLPPVPPVPNTGGVTLASAHGKVRKTLDAWTAKVNAVYPEFWVENGGPIRTVRDFPARRHVPARTPYGGYDLSISTADAAALAARLDPQGTLL